MEGVASLCKPETSKFSELTNTVHLSVESEGPCPAVGPPKVDLPFGNREQRQAMRYEPVRGRNAEELRATEQKASAVPRRAPGLGRLGLLGSRGCEGLRLG